MTFQNCRLGAKLWLSVGLLITALVELSAAVEPLKDQAMRLAGVASRFRLAGAAR